MRILHAMECTIGGTRRHLVDVARGQLARGHEVGLAVSCEREPRFRADLQGLSAAGAQVFEVPMVRPIAPFADLAHQRTLGRILRAWRPQIVHTHASKAGALGRCASLLEDIGTRVHTPHAFAFLFAAEFSTRKRALFRGVESFLAGSTARIVAVSEGEAETFRSSGVVPAGRVRVVRNGIEAGPWLDARPVDRARHGFDTDRPLVVVAGLLHVAKGQDLALEALARPELSDVQLAILGEGPMGESLRGRAAELGLTERARFLGWSDDVPGWMAAADLVLVPSRWEAMPYVVLEAMASSKPVVVTRVDGARELVQDGRQGVLCEIGDPASLAAAVARVLALPQDARARLGQAGRERALGLGSAERMVDELLAVYGEVL